MATLEPHKLIDPANLRFRSCQDSSTLEAIITYNCIEADDGEKDIWQFERIMNQQGPQSYYLLIQWENGETTWEQLSKDNQEHLK